MPRLPEEILNRVLADVLDIPNYEFYDDVTDLHINAGARWAWAPGKEYLRHEDRRPPALLRVCKAWRRIGTPHLYRSVFIRTDGQADALAITLTTLRPDLGAYIRRLRPSAGRGPAMYNILKSAAQLSVLNLALFARVDENIDGLIKGLSLPHINPTELRILCDHDYDVSKRMALIEALINAFPTWTNLVRTARFSHWFIRNLGAEKRAYRLGSVFPPRAWRPFCHSCARSGYRSLSGDCQAAPRICECPHDLDAQGPRQQPQHYQIEHVPALRLL